MWNSTRARWCWLGLFWCVLFVLTHVPRLPRSLQRGSDKVAHFVAYGLLCALLCWAFSRTRWSLKKQYLVIAVIIPIYAALDEILQIPVGRVCDIEDWYADMLGAGIVLLIVAGSRWLARRK